MEPIIFISENTYKALDKAANVAQTYLANEKGELYKHRDLKAALHHWIEECIEELAEEAIYHIFTGDRSCAFNRHGFVAQLKRLPCTEIDKSQDEDSSMLASSRPHRER